MTTPQTPLRSGFGPRTSTAEVLDGKDLGGKVAIVTGGYAGVGLATTRALASAGARVVVPVRDEAKAVKNLDGIPNVKTAPMDLTDPRSIDAFAERFEGPLHLLVNNAGVMASPLRRDARGNELQFSTNHLGHFHLTARLWPALLRANGARVVQVSSLGHALSPVDLEDPAYERRPYDRWAAYGQSKTANCLFALALDRRGERHGVRAFSLHPGRIMTDLVRHLSKEDLVGLGVLDEQGQPRTDDGANMKTMDQGAATSIWCATSSLLDGKGGVYCEDCDVAVAHDPAPGATVDEFMALGRGIMPWARDEATAGRLWTLSERLTVPFTT